MVTNSFEKRNFMQPMGRHSRCLAFFRFKLGEGEGFFFSFFLGSKCVPQHVFHSTSLLSHMLWQMFSLFHLYTWAKGEELYTSNYRMLPIYGDQ
jgi:hypothetical protein